MMRGPVPYRASHAPHFWGERPLTVAKNAKVAKELRAGLQSAFVQHLTMGRPIALAPLGKQSPPKLFGLTLASVLRESFEIITRCWLSVIFS